MSYPMFPGERLDILYTQHGLARDADDTALRALLRELGDPLDSEYTRRVIERHSSRRYTFLTGLPF